ncbi:tetratricopeptide repeat protein [Halosquirtibacter laminarini]|uniref:Tetratricopeptide repeat protein n=1 Tax=Halosquirtibacter laminarini TaxID=3374600 RepID=A0AC61NGW3_9BACT|nr:tetratricopeptide repeat protein [Prolixibacteraceae bacterium]
MKEYYLVQVIIKKQVTLALNKILLKKYTFRIIFSIIFSLHTLAIFAQFNTQQYFYHGRSKLHFENYVGAIKDFNIVIRLEPNNYEALFFRAVAKQYLEDYYGAKEDLDKAIEIKPYYPLAFMQRGMVNHSLKNYEIALDDYKKAMELDINNYSIYNNKGITEMALKDYKEAIKSYSRALKLNNRAINTYLNRSIAYQITDSLDLAIKDCTSAIKIRPHYDRAYLIRGRIKLEKDDFAGAIMDLNEAIRLNSRSSNSFFVRGLAKQKLGDLDGASTDYTMSIQLDPSMASAYLNRGLIKREKKQSSAEMDIQTACTLDPRIAKFQRRLRQEQQKRANPWYYAISHKAKKKGTKKTKNPNTSAPSIKPVDIHKKEKKTDTEKVSAKNLNLAQKLERGKLRRQEDRTGSQPPLIVGDNGKVTLTTEQPTEGLVQNINVIIELSPNFDFTYFNQHHLDYSKMQYFSMEVDKLNELNDQNPFLALTNHIQTSVYRYDEMQKYKEHIALFDALVATGEQPELFYLDRAILKNLSFEFESAKKDFTLSKKYAPKNILTYFGSANNMVDMADYLRSISETQKALLGDLEEKDEVDFSNYKEALIDYQKVVQMNPKFHFAWFNIGNTYIKMEDYNNAIEYYNKAVEVFPAFAEAYFNRGLTKIYLKDIEGGALDLSKAGELGMVQAYNIIKRYCD